MTLTRRSLAAVGREVARLERLVEKAKNPPPAKPRAKVERVVVRGPAMISISPDGEVEIIRQEAVEGSR
jgi:hypothetical protein